ncbi:uncharacterized protein LOC6551795 [Drosophila erecta]|uniref:GG23013 n=1 Tax=Drosophila erecta TaxID=7220 RepID=B3NZ36_DROER|nr:uncharacterized protein LOC6551795 [Drosophila erecta]EDV48578.1 uncharacterized protein Dere_GG23013 [Drosophila erecta]
MAENPPEEASPIDRAEGIPAAEDAPNLVAIAEAVEGAEVQGDAADADQGVEEIVDGGTESVLPAEDDQASKEGRESTTKHKGPVTADERKREKLLRIKERLAKKKEEEASHAAMVEAPVESEEMQEVEAREELHSVESGAEESADDFEDIQAILSEKPPTPHESIIIEEDVESEGSIDEPLPRLGMSIKSEFIRGFESLPSISDISLDPEPEAQIESGAQKSISRLDTENEGEVQKDDTEDPGEGESSDSDQDASTAQIAADESEEDEDSVLMDDLPDEQAQTEKQVIIGEEVDTMAMFAVAIDAEVQPQQEVVVPVEEPFWYRLTVDFLNNLINTVVDNVESADKNKEHLLDKRKMLLELQRLVDEYTSEKYQNTLVNNVVCDYFRRNRKFNNFQPLPPDDVAGEFNRYMNALNSVDNLMERVKMIKMKYGHSTSRAMLELNSYSVLAFNEEQRLEGFMRKTLIRKDMDRLKRALDNDLRRMQDLRNQISEKRYELNLNLHNLAFVDEKVMKFERVTETLTISQMLCANESIIQLSKQLEEKCKDVAVMQSNYKKSMIEETCVREKRDMIAYMLSKARAEYIHRFERRNSLRKDLTRLQLEHAHLKTVRAKLEVKGGLLFKAGLMYDYDKCMADIETRRAHIQAMKKTCKELGKRIQTVEHSKQSNNSIRFLS